MGTMSKTTRREFLATSSTAALAATMANSFGRFAYGDGSETIRIALVGCGGRGTGAVSQLFNTSGSTRLVAVADAFREKADASLKHLKDQDASSVDVAEDRIFTGLDAYQHAIDSDCDLVVIATPPGFKPGQFEYAIKRGKHVFMEKPVASDAPGIRQILAANEIAKQKNLKVGVGLQRHHQKPYIECVKALQDGAVGDFTTFRVYWNGGGVWVRPRRPGQTEMEYQVQNWYYFNWLCGDHITEQHIHNLDVANWVKGGHPVEAQGQGGREVRTSNETGQIYDHHFVEFTYADGTKMFSQCRHIPDCWNHVDEYVEGTKGRSHISRWIQATGGDRQNFGGGQNPYQVEHDDLFEAIRKDTPYNEAEYGAHSTMTSILGRMATYSGKVVKWDEALANGKRLVPPPAEWGFDKTPPVTPTDGKYPVAVPGKYNPFA
jgi:predicted dehydrogenase